MPDEFAYGEETDNLGAFAERAASSSIINDRDLAERTIGGVPQLHCRGRDVRRQGRTAWPDRR